MYKGFAIVIHSDHKQSKAKAKLSGICLKTISDTLRTPVLFCFMFKDTLMTQLDVLLSDCHCKVV